MTADPGLRDALVEGAARWLAGAYGEERRRRTLANGAFDAAAWGEMAEFGWFGLAVPERHGGLGLSLGDLAALVRTVGAANLPEPVAAVAGVAAPLLAQAAGRSGAAAALLADVVAGSRIVTLAHAEPDQGYSRDAVRTRLVREATGWRLEGAKAAVEGGARPDAYLVTARAEDRAALVLVDAAAPGLAVSAYRALDGRALADLAFEAVRLPPWAFLPVAGTAVEDALDRGAVLAMADAVGAMAVLLEDTLAHLRTRTQFGRPLGSFQALQHRAVDMAIALEEARAVVEAAAEAQACDPLERRRAVATAKVVGARAARRIAREAVQMHGGIGITEESRVSHLFRRLVVAESLYGDDDFYLDRFRAAGEFAGSPAAEPASAPAGR
ncbi:Acryloyl-CoA reductase (NADH) [Methylobacterium crusticola]|uniref:Acryloyl-CoA reductase (NADH) n=1 Tax=Methylobacterium crusticola TaxID=1697972 RepID=A0ABQ4R5J3_9HYPH|nr:acyl-CoA dehydrogenase family protein [Methylobacterium crusticola]GJD52210.1 Acryloyl-CoA reductase (NADH) [Methylobacterium crusticola]